jgi:hypothetical protein
MKRILSDSPVKEYQLFRFEKKKADGSSDMLPNWYIWHGDKTTCTGTDRLTGRQGHYHEASRSGCSGPAAESAHPGDGRRDGWRSREPRD